MQMQLECSLEPSAKYSCSEEEATAQAFTWRLAHKHHVDQDTYADAARTFGDKGLVDMVMLIGLYMTTCAIIHVPSGIVIMSEENSGE